MRFFSECSMMMEMRHNVAEIVDYSWKSSVPLHVAAMDFQKGSSSRPTLLSPHNNMTYFPPATTSIND